MSFFLGRNSKEKLVFGYVRHYQHTYTPTAIINECLKFYDQTIYWIFEEENVNLFYECKNQNYLAGPKFQIYNVEFENTLWYEYTYNVLLFNHHVNNI